MAGRSMRSKRGRPMGSRNISRRLKPSMFRKPRVSKSLYDGDAYIKVEKSAILAIGAGNEFWAGCRTDNATSTGSTDMSYLDAPEF